MENEQNQNLNTTPPPVQPVVEPAKPSFLSSKWLKIGIGTLLVILVLSGTFILGKNSENKNQAATTVTKTLTPTPTPVDETANWKIYLGTGYAIRYPQNYYLSKTGRGADYIGASKESIDKYLSGKSLSDSEFVISLLSLDEHLNNLQEVADRIKTGQFSPTGTPYIAVKAGTTLAAKVSIDNGTNYGITNKSFFVWFQITPSKASNEKLMEKILSTFKFTDSFGETANWKTYNDPKDLYSFKYPPSWFINGENSSNSHNSIGISPLKLQEVEGATSNIIAFNVADNPDNLSIEDYVRLKLFAGAVKYTTLTIAGITAEKTSDLPGQFDNEEVLVGYKGKIYTITLIKAPGQEIPESMFSQILSAFKFTQ